MWEKAENLRRQSIEEEIQTTDKQKIPKLLLYL